MNRHLTRASLLPNLLLVAGCISPQNTRLPSLAATDPRAERQSYEIHDPLPDREGGPFAGGLPRGFDIQRSEPRRVRERYVSPVPRNPDGSPTGQAPAVLKHSQTVRE